MSAEADAVCGAPYSKANPDRVDRRNGYYERRWDAWVGSTNLAIQRLLEGSYFPDWLLQSRR